MVRVLAIVLILAALVTPAAANEITWKISIWGPPRTGTKPLEWFAKEVAAKTNGQMKFEITYNKGKSTDSADLLKSNSADGASFCAQYFGDKMPLSTVIDLPMFAPDNVTALGKVELALADHPALQHELRAWNVKMLLPMPLPQYQLMGTRRVAKVDDLMGAKIRIAAEMGKILEEYGASSTVVQPNEAVTLMKSGGLDLIALPYPYSYATFNIHEASKYVTDKISLGAPLCYIGVNQKSWDALPPKVQEVMLSLRPAVIAQFEGLYAQEDAGHIAAFKAKGLEFVPFSVADRARLVAKAIKYWHAWVEEREKQGLKARELFEFTQAKIREFRK